MSGHEPEPLDAELRSALDASLGARELQELELLTALDIVQHHARDDPRPFAEGHGAALILRELIERHSKESREWAALAVLAGVPTDMRNASEGARVRRVARLLRPEAPYTERHVRRLVVQRLIPLLREELLSFDREERYRLESRGWPTRPYQVTRIEVESFYRSGRFLSHALDTFGIVALAPSVEVFTRAVEFGPEVTADDIAFEPLDDSTVTDVLETGHGFIVATVKFKRPLAQGEERELGLRLSLRRRVETYPILSWRSRNPARRLQLTMHFDPAQPPRRVWELRGVPQTEIPGPPRAASFVRPRKDGIVPFSATDMESGLAYGLEWEW